MLLTLEIQTGLSPSRRLPTKARAAVFLRDYQELVQHGIDKGIVHSTGLSPGFPALINRQHDEFRYIHQVQHFDTMAKLMRITSLD